MEGLPTCQPTNVYGAGEMINQYPKETITNLQDMPTNRCFASNDEGI
jgi:hypothetical protein